MNSFSNMEINDLLDNRFRLEEKHTPNYLAECFQRLFPTLGRMGLSTVIDEMARANHRAFNSSKLPIRGETLDLRFFFELWKREFRFEGGIYDKFTFGDELKLAHNINQREFWEVLIRADREIGTYLKDCFELFLYRELPQEISFNLRAGGGSLDYKDASRIRELLPRTNGSLGKMEDIAKACISIWGMPKFFDERRLVEELCRENNIRRAGISSSMTREPCVPYPLKNIANLRVDFLKRAAEDRFREDRKMEELSFKEFEIQEVEVPTNSLPPLSQQELLLRSDYRGHGDPVEPTYPPIISISSEGVEFIKDWEDFVPYVYDDQEKKSADKKTRVNTENRANVKGTETIGYGFTLRYNKKFEEYISNKELLLSKEEAETHLKSILSNDYCKAAARSVGRYLLAQHQFDAVVSIIYNMGIGGFEKTGIYRAILESDMEKAAEEIYNIGLGTEHSRRRAAEQILFKYGRYEKRT